MTIPAALASLKSALAAFPKEEVSEAEAMKWWEKARVKRHPGEFEDWPSDEQKSYFVRGGR